MEHCKPVNAQHIVSETMPQRVTAGDWAFSNTTHLRLLDLCLGLGDLWPPLSSSWSLSALKTNAKQTVCTSSIKSDDEVDDDYRKWLSKYEVTLVEKKTFAAEQQTNTCTKLHVLILGYACGLWSAQNTVPPKLLHSVSSLLDWGIWYEWHKFKWTNNQLAICIIVPEMWPKV